MSLIPFPNVPQLPGVPQLVRSNTFPAGPPPGLGTVAQVARLLWDAINGAPKWGIFKSQNVVDGAGQFIPGQTKLVPTVVPDNIIEFGFKQDWNVSDFPVQAGGFASYNKVNNPFEISLRLTKGGSESDRTDFLNQIDAIAGTLELYQILTPERTYSNVNVTRYEVSRRGAKGAYWLSEVDIYFREVRTVDAQYSNTAANTLNAQDPSARPTTNNGTTQFQFAAPGIPAPSSDVIVGLIGD